VFIFGGKLVRAIPIPQQQEEQEQVENQHRNQAWHAWDDALGKSQVEIGK
jgi:hypothetical protein